MSTEGNLPFVSAVCVTAKSPRHVKELLPHAIRAWEQQTYPLDRRELLVVADGCLDELLEVCPEDTPSIRKVLEDKGSLGRLRNTGMASAKGSLVIQWDDDDWHHPERIATQVRVFGEGEGEPVCLQRQLCYDVERDVAFIRHYCGGFIHGTVLHRVQGTKPYPEQGKEEDTVFLRQWETVRVVDNPPELYVRFFHGDDTNTWDRRHVMREAHDWRPGTWGISEASAEYLDGVLKAYGWTRRTGSPRAFRPEDYPILKGNAPPGRPRPMCCAGHGGSHETEHHNATHGFYCPACTLKGAPDAGIVAADEIPTLTAD